MWRREKSDAEKTGFGMRFELWGDRGGEGGDDDKAGVDVSWFWKPTKRVPDKVKEEQISGTAQLRTRVVLSRGDPFTCVSFIRWRRLRVVCSRSLYHETPGGDIVLYDTCRAVAGRSGGPDEKRKVLSHVFTQIPVTD